MGSSPTGWRLNLLGQSTLTHPDGRTVHLDRKTAATLALLALDRPLSRLQLSALLWPDTPPASARNNLVHLFRRLRINTGEDLTEMVESALRLVPSVDTTLTVTPPGPGPHVLLGEFEYDDTPELADWVLSQREALLTRQLSSGHQRMAAHERAGRPREALDIAQQLVLADPLSEDLYRTVMRLHYALGDRPAALRAYHRCREVLLTELGVEPLPETVELARAIDRGTLGTFAEETAVPLSVRRPPNLIGRETEWSQLEVAWAAGQGMLVTGDAGSGKSRLAIEFLRSKHTHPLLLFGGLPGDIALPYTADGRTYREIVAACPDLKLPGWAQHELSRVLSAPGVAPPLLVAEADRVRFYEARVEVIRQVAARGPVTLAFDDLQLMDDASIEASLYVFSRFWGDPSSNLRTLLAFRSHSLSARVTALIQPTLEAGRVAWIDLAPLNEAAVTALLHETGLGDAAHLVPDLQRLTAGNPQLLLEAVKAMYETGRFELPSTGAAVTGSVEAVIRDRLARLSGNALQAARAAGVLGGALSPELVAEVLHVGLVEVAEAWEELERAQIMTGERFAHALVLEQVLAQTPPSTRRLLHRSAARLLAHAAAPPAVIAQHWLDGQDPLQAAPWLVRAGEQAEASHRYAEAATLYGQAAEVYGAAGLASQAASARTSRQAVDARRARLTERPN